MSEEELLEFDNKLNDELINRTREDYVLYTRYDFNLDYNEDE